MVFAVVFAPVGAVLGHLALSEIKKRHQAGHTRALVGVTLSYVVIVLAVVSVVVWALIPDRTSTSTLATSPATTTSQHPITGDALHRVLLDGGELTKLLDTPFKAQPGLMGDGTAGSFDTLIGGSSTPPKCTGVVNVAHKDAYASATVQRVAGEYWWGTGVGRVLTVDEAAVALPTAPDVQTLFAKFSEQWKACDGQTVTTPPGSQGGENIVEHIRGVTITDSVLSATLDMEIQDGDTVPVARAVGIQGNCLVDVLVHFHLPWPDEPGSADPKTSGIDVARAMMDKASKLS
nr:MULTISPECIES: sensor domain-containing protein [Mycobacterium]